MGKKKHYVEDEEQSWEEQDIWVSPVQGRVILEIEGPSGTVQQNIMTRRYAKDLSKILKWAAKYE